MILVLGGTHEGKLICDYLNSQNQDFVLSVATELGISQYQSETVPCIIKRFTMSTLVDYIKANKVTLIIDATHPHAGEITKTAIDASSQTEIPYYRFERKIAPLDTQGINIKEINDFESVLSYLKTTQGNILITGTKHIAAFHHALGKSRCYFRIMPSKSSIEDCEREGVALDHIIGIKAPCPPELTQCLFKVYDIQFFVFKNSGRGSAIMDNLASLKESHVEGLVFGTAYVANSDKVYHELEDLYSHLPLHI